MKPWKELKKCLSQSAFRSKFRLNHTELRYIAEKGFPEITNQCHEFIHSRLASANPPNDGRQTPMRGHPCFVAQHATGTCCRSCLAKWHQIAKGNELSEEEIEYIVKILINWIEEHSSEVPNFPYTPKLNLIFPDE